MKFTIAIPTYNNADVLENAINSAINQTYKDSYEVLVVDNCSSDDTQLIINKFPDKIRVIRNEKTVSQFKNHNICLENAKGDYVVFCHSDDQLLSNSLDKYFTILNQRSFPEKYIFWGRSMFNDFYSCWNNGGFRLNEIASGLTALNCFKLGGITPSGTCYSRISFLEFGGFYEMNTAKSPSDLCTMWGLCFNFFEFEMVDRIFLKRYFATIGGPGSKINEYNAILDAFKVAKGKLSTEEFEILIDNFLKFDRYINPSILNVLIKEKFYPMFKIRLKLIRHFLKNPYLLLRNDYLKLLFI